MVGAVLVSGAPDPKSRTLARGERRYRRKVASSKQWQAIIAAKRGPCRVCLTANGPEQYPGVFGPIQWHHIVAREDHGDDCEDNIVPLHQFCHMGVTQRLPRYCQCLLWQLSDAEYAYMIERGGEDYPERAYGVEYRR